MNDYRGAAEDYLSRLSRVLNLLDREQIDTAISVIGAAWRAGRQIITFGNGGSSMTALHFVNDWNKGLFTSTGRPFRGRSLVDNIGLVTAYGNDASFQDIFIEQLKNLFEPGDLVIAISGSGNSENVIRAVMFANEHGCTTLGLCGFGGGRLKSVAHYALAVNTDDMQLSEDVHAIFGHIATQRLSREI